ncbi:MAG: ribonuclease R [Clostridia bacterium]|nr:ribonuclease R [Clostridia bacterium]
MKKEKIGIFKANEKGFGFVKVEDELEEIFVAKEHTKNALNGDKVLVIIIKDKQENSHEEGKIIKVLEHERSSLVGTFQKSKNFGFVIPDDKRFGTDIFISKKDINGAKNNEKVVVKITKYPQRGKNAEGVIDEIIGNINQAGIDILSLIKEYGLPYEFPKAVLDEAQNIRGEITQKEISKRLDLRSQEMFTIDGEDAKDLDDAVCVQKNTDGNYTLGVHIADVSHYVREGSMLDKEAIIRGTSVYMMDRVIPMLPKELSNGICSLNAGEDRLALSVIMDIDSNGKVVSGEVKKTIINVTKRMNYSDVKDILLSLNEGTIEKYKPYVEHFRLMQELAEILKKRREKDGSLNLDIPESKVVLNEKGIAVDIKKYELSIANEIIEQFMLTANETVAEKFYWLEAPFIYRVHEEPDLEKITELNKFLYNVGYKIKASKDNIHPKAFAEILEGIKGKPEEKIISNLILRTLKVARYEPDNKGHFGIASKYYCHFTSPIRRYPDLFIHRVISYYIEKNYDVNQDVIERYKSQSEKYSGDSSDCEKTAQKAERDSIDIKKAEYMSSKVGLEFEGIISNVTGFGIFVELENTIEGLIRFENLGDEYYIYDEDRKHLIGERSKKVYKIGDKIKIRVILADKVTRRIDFEKAE